MAGTQVVDLEKWNPQNFCALIEQSQVTLSSLVPAQVFDLVAGKFKAPKSLRAIIVGGGAISPTLLSEAVWLGWPLLPTYGMTECCSQVATADFGNRDLRILDHVEVKVVDGRIAVKSESLLTTYAFLSESGVSLMDPKVDGWFLTEDRGEVIDDCLLVHGRHDDFIKIGGESVMMSRLQELFERARMKAVVDVDFDAAIFVMPDERLGSVIHLAATCEKYKELVEVYNELVLPFERIRGVHVVDQIPRSALNKLLVNHLKLKLLKV